MSVLGEFPTGEEVEISLMLPGRSKTDSLKGRVVWKGPADMIGLEFSNVTPDVRDHIDALVWQQVDLTKI